MKGIVGFIRTFKYQAYHLLCRDRKTLITYTDKGYALTIADVVIRSIMPCNDFELQNM